MERNDRTRREDVTSAGRIGHRAGATRPRVERAGKGEQAEKVLLDLIERRGPSSETYGILGRVYKDRWEAAKKAGSTVLPRGLLDKAISAYLKGFEADWRDAYPGVNAVTLMMLREPPDSRKDELVSIVAYAVK